MRDFIVRPDHERLKSVARIQPASVLFACAAVVGALAGTAGCGFPAASLPAAESTAQTNFTVARPAEDGSDRGLQGGHVITLNPELIDVVGDEKRYLVRGRAGSVLRRKTNA